jgi:hypothetical protein
MPPESRVLGKLDEFAEDSIVLFEDGAGYIHWQYLVYLSTDGE